MAWNWLSFSKRGRSFSMEGRMVILKGEENKRRAKGVRAMGRGCAAGPHRKW